MARTKKRVPSVITKILKAVDNMSPAEAAEALQEAARYEGSVENRVLLLQARIKLLQDSQKPKRPPRKRKRKPPKVEKPVETAPEPEKEASEGTVTAIDLDDLGALFGAVENSTADADPPKQPAKKPAKPNAAKGVDFDGFDELMADDDADGDGAPANEIDMSALAELGDPPDTPDTPPKSGGAIEMPDLSALNDLDDADDTDQDADDADDLSALMAAMNEQSATARAQPDAATALPDLSALDALDDAPEEDTAEPDDLSDLMNALSEEDSDENTEGEAPEAAEVPDLSALDALDDVPEEDAAEADELSALMSALSEEDSDENTEDEAPEAAEDPDLSALDALADAPEADTADAADDLSTLMEAVSEEENTTTDVAAGAQKTLAATPETEPEKNPDEAGLPASGPVASEERSADPADPDYSEFEALMGKTAQGSDQQPTMGSQAPDDPVTDAPEPAPAPAAPEMTAEDADGVGTAIPEQMAETDYSEFDALMAAAEGSALDVETAPGDDALQAPDLSAPDMHDETPGDTGAEAQDMPETAGALSDDLPASPDLSVLGDLDDAHGDPCAIEPQATPAPDTEPAGQPVEAETTAAAFAEGKKKATLDDLYRLFPKGDR